MSGTEKLTDNTDFTDNDCADIDYTTINYIDRAKIDTF